MAQASGDHRGAVKSFAKAIDADEANAACRYNAGNSYQALGNRTKSIAHFGKALALGMEERVVPLHPAKPRHCCLYRAHCRQVAVTDYGLRIVWRRCVSRRSPRTSSCAPRWKRRSLPSVQLERLLACARAELLRAGRASRAMMVLTSATISWASPPRWRGSALSMNMPIRSPNPRVSLRAHCAIGCLGISLPGRTITPITLAVVAAYFPLHALQAADTLLRRDWTAVDGRLCCACSSASRLKKQRIATQSQGLSRSRIAYRCR